MQWERALDKICLTGTWNLCYINNYTILNIIMLYAGFYINVLKNYDYFFTLHHYTIIIIPILFFTKYIIEWGHIMDNIRLFRKRFIPEEIIELKNDNIIHFKDNIIITKWDVLKPRHDINNGISAYFINDGIKVSKIFNENGILVYWYCDIIETIYNNKTNSFTFNDLLIDILIYPDGHVEVVDMDEFADAMESGILSNSTIAAALRNADSLLKTIYSGNFNKYTSYIENI